MSRIILWQEMHPTIHGGAESWANDTLKGLQLLGHSVAWLKSPHIQRACEEFQPDVVIIGLIHCTMGLQHALWLAESGIPTLWMMHDYWPFCGSRMLMQEDNRTDLSCEAVTGRCANSCGLKVQPEVAAFINRFYVVTGCFGAAEILRTNGINVRAIVEEGIDTDLFPALAKQRELPPAVYASAAGKDLWKGVHFLEDAAEKGGFKVRFLTGLSRSELGQVLGKAAVYAFPSVYQEIWGLALTEAMACGCAVVAADVAGARAQLHEGMGLLVPAHDAAALQEGLAKVLYNPEVAAEMGQAAREHVLKDHGLMSIGARWEIAIKEAQKCAV